MSNAVISVELEEPVMHDAAEIAAKNGMSVAGWIASTIEDRLRNERLTAEFYRRRASGGDGKVLLEVLAKGPNLDPEPGDVF